MIKINKNIIPPIEGLNSRIIEINLHDAEREEKSNPEKSALYAGLAARGGAQVLDEIAMAHEKEVLGHRKQTERRWGGL